MHHLLCLAVILVLVFSPVGNNLLHLAVERREKAFPLFILSLQAGQHQRQKWLLAQQWHTDEEQKKNNTVFVFKYPRCLVSFLYVLYIAWEIYNSEKPVWVFHLPFLFLPVPLFTWWRAHMLSFLQLLTCCLQYMALNWSGQLGYQWRHQPNTWPLWRTADHGANTNIRLKHYWMLIKERSKYKIR